MEQRQPEYVNGLQLDANNRFCFCGTGKDVHVNNGMLRCCGYDVWTGKNDDCQGPKSCVVKDSEGRDVNSPGSKDPDGFTAVLCGCEGISKDC